MVDLSNLIKQRNLIKKYQGATGSNIVDNDPGSDIAMQGYALHSGFEPSDEFPTYGDYLTNLGQTDPSYQYKEGNVQGVSAGTPYQNWQIAQRLTEPTQPYSMDSDVQAAGNISGQGYWSMEQMEANPLLAAGNIEIGEVVEGL